MSYEAVGGWCRSCGRELVHVLGGETYHPAVHVTPDQRCPSLLPIPGTDSFSLAVPGHLFRPEEERVGCASEGKDGNFCTYPAGHMPVSRDGRTSFLHGHLEDRVWWDE